MGKSDNKLKKTDTITTITYSITILITAGWFGMILFGDKIFSKENPMDTQTCGLVEAGESPGYHHYKEVCTRTEHGKLLDNLY